MLLVYVLPAATCSEEARELVTYAAQYFRSVRIADGLDDTPCAAVLPSKAAQSLQLNTGNCLVHDNSMQLDACTLA